MPSSAGECTLRSGGFGVLTASRSGSIMFQRDLRQWAKDKVGMKFDSSGM